MNPASQKKIDDWLKQKCLLFVCQACGQRQWNADELVSGLLGDGDVDVANAQLAPFVPIVCMNCGYTVLFSAVIMGVAPNKGSSG